MTSISTTGCISFTDLPEIVSTAISNCQVIDLHTHLFPPEHNNLLLWGIDELLTYHYLVSEFFMVAPGNITHASFFILTKSQQADLVWEHLFQKRTPLSEAQIGVLTTLRKLGLNDLLKTKDLHSIRKWFATQNPTQHAENVFVISKVKYVVMTNIPFLATETSKWITSTTSKIINDSFLKQDVLPQTFDRNRFKTGKQKKIIFLFFETQVLNCTNIFLFLTFFKLYVSIHCWKEIGGQYHNVW